MSNHGRDDDYYEYEEQKRKEKIASFKKISTDDGSIIEVNNMIDKIHQQLYRLRSHDVPMSRNPADNLEEAFNTLNKLKEWLKS